MEPSIPFHTLVELVDAEDFTTGKIRTLVLPLDINLVTAKLESHNLFSESYEPIAERFITQNTDPNYKKKRQLGKHCKYCYHSHHSVSNCLRQHFENGILFPDRYLLRSHLINNLEHNRIVYIQMKNLHSFLLSLFQVTVNHQEIIQIQEPDILHNSPLVRDHLQFHVFERKTLVLNIVIVEENSSLTELHHVQHTLTFTNNEETLGLFIIFLPETTIKVLSLDLNLITDKISEIKLLCIDLHQAHIQDLHLHLEDLLII